MTGEKIKELFSEGKNCSDENCSETCYGIAKVVFWSLFFSLFIIGPRIWSCYKSAISSDPTLGGFIDAGILLWVAVWIATAALVAHEKINHFLTLLINSMSLPGFIIGIAALVGAGA